MQLINVTVDDYHPLALTGHVRVDSIELTACTLLTDGNEHQLRNRGDDSSPTYTDTVTINNCNIRLLAVDAFNHASIVHIVGGRFTAVSTLSTATNINDISFSHATIERFGRVNIRNTANIVLFECTITSFSGLPAANNVQELSINGTSIDAWKNDALRDAYIRRVTIDNATIGSVDEGAWGRAHVQALIVRHSRLGEVHAHIVNDMQAQQMSIEHSIIGKWADSALEGAQITRQLNINQNSFEQVCF